MPKIDNIEETPNPNAVKFVLKEPVSNGAARSFHAAEAAAEDALAHALFAAGGGAWFFNRDNMTGAEKGEGPGGAPLPPPLPVPTRAAGAARGGAPPASEAGAGGGALGVVLSDDPR